MAKATVTKTVRLHEALAKRLEQAARDTLTSENAVTVAAIMGYLEQHEKRRR